MSANPAHAVEENLQSFAEITSPADNIPTPSRRREDRLARATQRDSGIAFLPQSSQNMAGRAKMDNGLPENDGMQSLRHQLQDIKMLAVSTDEKARRMHFLMTQDYLKHKQNTSPSPSLRPEAIHFDINEPGTAMLGAAAMPIDPQNPYSLRPGDLDPVVSPLPRNQADRDEDQDYVAEDDRPELGCMHYKRNVKVQCFDCQRWFPCRHCHDQSNDLSFPHSLRRKMTQNMLCMLCKTPQSAAELCAECGEYAAYYYCHKCKLWDNDSNKRIYHCDDCGICRVGEGLGKDFVHCRRCNVCISISTKAAHPCIERATEGNCPLCLVPLFESRTSVVSLPCGHYMHGDCYKDLMAVTYRCPVCSKSAVNMELQWRKLDDEIAAQPMPENDDDLDAVLPHLEGNPEARDAALAESRPYRPREVWVGCNDCGARSWTPFHWLGFKCQRCDSYNTNQMAPTAVHETETERLLRQHQVHRHDFVGAAVLADAGIGIVEPDIIPNTATLQIPESPSYEPTSTTTNLSNSPRSDRGAQSPGRYFVQIDEEPRRPSFSGFSAPSMPNLPTLSTFSAENMPTLPNFASYDMPRMPRMPHLPQLPNFRHNLPDFRQNLNLPNSLELPRFRPYEMMDAVSRSLSPMRYYLRGLDVKADGENEEVGRVVPTRSASVRSDPGLRFEGEGSKGFWTDVMDDESSEEEEEEEQVDEGDDVVEEAEEWELIGHR